MTQLLTSWGRGPYRRRAGELGAPGCQLVRMVPVGRSTLRKKIPVFHFAKRATPPVRPPCHDFPHARARRGPRSPSAATAAALLRTPPALLRPSCDPPRTRFRDPSRAGRPTARPRTFGDRPVALRRRRRTGNRLRRISTPRTRRGHGRRRFRTGPGRVPCLWGGTVHFAFRRAMDDL
ncbi:hypothetical protein SBD_6352 [Streptomyces bottropensis ATCC 25435]|uniref:Uncharacterized protein n=1 Tax=Streptomyces bottropensis ATCC 25435 TaxID=1054862 RepID=M3FG19_9ACTN|nr:hypothetical protein SBD_6352 [Streptomyces bottropensis ATCC 25435]